MNRILQILYYSLILCLFILPLSLVARDYTNNLPSQIILQNGERRFDNLTATCGNQYCTFGTPGFFNPRAFDFSYSTNGGSSSLVFFGKTPQNPYGFRNSVFMVGGFHIGTQSKLTIEDFHTLAVQRGLVLDENATLEVILQKGQRIPASEYGPSSKVYIGTANDLYLGNGSTLNVSNGDYFIANSKTIVGNNTRLIVDTGIIRFHNAIQNNGSIELSGKVENTGYQSAGKTDLTLSSVVNYGTINITGDFQNGGNPTADGIFDVANPGAGNLINYGGTITISGKLTNNQALNHYMQTRGSSVQIYGGSIIVRGGMENNAGNTLIFGAYNGVLGKLEGNLVNQGKVQVNIAGANLGSHQLITGSVTGNTNFEILTNGRKSEFINTTMQGNSLSIQKKHRRNQ